MADYTEKTGIKSWAEDDRPREKMREKGRQALSDAELIAILMGSGSRNLSAVDLAKQILTQYNHRLADLSRANIVDLCKSFKGVGEAKAISILAALELGRRRREEETTELKKITSSRDAYEWMNAVLADIEHEEFWILLLGRSNKVKERIRISSGGVAGTVVDQRLIFKAAIGHLASSIILCHNHPSGNLAPSEQDKALTKKLQQAGAMLDIPVIDHIIYTDESYFSFADEGLL